MAVVIALVGCLSACDGITYKIISPPDDSIHDTLPESIIISYTLKPESPPEMTLNGVVVTDHFILGETEASAKATDLKTYIVNGENILRVNPPYGPHSTFIYDPMGPEIIILEADHGNRTKIKGVAVDDAGTGSLQVNGVAVAVNSDGSFTADVPAADVYDFKAEDFLGHKTSVQYRDYSLPYDRSLRARLNQSGMDFIAEELIPVVNGLDFNELVGGMTLYSAVKKGPLGNKWGPEGFLTNVSMHLDSIQLDPTKGGLRLRGVIKDVKLRLRLVMHDGFLPAIVIKPTANAASVVFNGNVNLSVGGHAPQIAISSLDIDVNHITFDGALGVFNPIMSPIVTAIVGLFEGRIANAIKNPLNKAIPELLDGLIPSSYDWQVSGSKMRMTFFLEELFTTDQSLILGLSGGVEAVSPNPLVAEPLGPRYTSDSLPNPVASQGDFSLAVNTNVINQALVAAYYSGITHMMILDDEIELNLPRDDTPGDDGTSRILIDPISPPCVQGNGSGTRLSAHGLRITHQMIKEGQWATQFSTQVSVVADIKISADSDSTLSIKFVSAPSVKVTNTEIGKGISISDSFINEMVNSVMPNVMQEISKSLSGIKIPEVEGYTFKPESFHGLGANKGHVGMAGTLKKAP